MLVGYVRVSSEGQNPSMQIEQFLKEGVTNDNIFRETASGKSMDRIEWKNCVGFLRKGDVLVLWSLDRMGRSTGAMITEFEKLRAKGVELKFLNGMMAGVDTRTDMGKMFYTICASFAEMERKNIRERCEAGRKRAQAAGVEFGRRVKEVDMIAFGAYVESGMSGPAIRAKMGIGRNKYFACKRRLKTEDNGQWKIENEEKKETTTNNTNLHESEIEDNKYGGNE